ncbi:transcriptional regulator, TrmB [Pyrobaculum islandicum DSM 4184]|uniref:Transcriptional regulator, TrmB n=1 Tax=Pyrobaculum islandicum (strain DSM 4184 / JCM 9189 / GEO3) TaxID=384616 RepID=A1RTA0_PYRIL|nr:helix-turn-helix domain-containing protein [Pyrobaculum islandicum]ABL88182.1 transcriptional regulator, TrmB [Pyrobaculum islandicum DSM 4184]
MEQLKKVSKLLGLGQREIDIYITLVEKGELTARDIADILKIPYTKTYIYLDKLIKLGFITRNEKSRPVKFKASPPIDIYRSLVNILSVTLKTLKPIFDNLQTIYESRYATAPTFLTLVRGSDRVGELIVEILKSSEDVAYLAFPFPELITPQIVDTLIEESKRIPIKMLVTEELIHRLNLPPRVEVKTVAEMFGGGAIGGAVVIYVKYSGEISGAYSNDRFMIEIARTYFIHVWQKASSLRPP